MTDQPSHSIDAVKFLSLRQVVQRRPAMYFGGYATGDWPLVIAAWTARDLLDRAVGGEPSVIVTLHQDGDLSAADRARVGLQSCWRNGS